MSHFITLDLTRFLCQARESARLAVRPARSRWSCYGSNPGVVIAETAVANHVEVAGRTSSLTPRALQTLATVSKRGRASGRRALYRASRVMPEDRAISNAFSMSADWLGLSPPPSKTTICIFGEELGIRRSKLTFCLPAQSR